MAAVFTEPLIEQLVALVYRDQSTYLTQFNETEPFREFSTVSLYPLNFPKIAIFNLDNMIVDTGSDNTILQGIHVRAAIQVAHQDRNILAMKCRHYIAALHLLFRHIEVGNNASDFRLSLPLPKSLLQIGTTTAGISPPTIVQRLRVLGHRYTQFGELKGQGFAMRAELDLLLQMEEQT